MELDPAGTDRDAVGHGDDGLHRPGIVERTRPRNRSLRRTAVSNVAFVTCIIAGGRRRPDPERAKPSGSAAGGEGRGVGEEQRFLAAAVDRARMRGCELWAGCPGSGARANGDLGRGRSAFGVETDRTVPSRRPRPRTRMSRATRWTAAATAVARKQAIAGKGRRASRGIRVYEDFYVYTGGDLPASDGRVSSGVRARLSSGRRMQRRPVQISQIVREEADERREAEGSRDRTATRCRGPRPVRGAG